jgi:hypothetical protein
MSFLDDDVVQSKLEGPAQTVFEEVMRVAQALDKLDIEIAIKQEELKQLENSKKQMEEVTLPAIMQQNRIETIGLDNGRTLSLKEVVFARVPENESGRKVVFDFLIEHGAGHLIKDTLTVQDAPDGIKSELREQGITYEEAQKVNTNSFVAFVKSSLGLSKGTMQTIRPDEFPKEAGLFIYKKAEIKKAK